METKLSEQERIVLKAILGQIVIKKRTGEIGILHGMERFVSTHITLKKSEQETLQNIATKVGISHGIKEVEG